MADSEPTGAESLRENEFVLLTKGNHAGRKGILQRYIKKTEKWRVELEDGSVLKVPSDYLKSISNPSGFEVVAYPSSRLVESDRVRMCIRSTQEMDQVKRAVVLVVDISGSMTNCQEVSSDGISQIRKINKFNVQAVGQRVVGKVGGGWYPGTVEAIKAKTIAVHFDDGYEMSLRKQDVLVIPTHADVESLRRRAQYSDEAQMAYFLCMSLLETHGKRPERSRIAFVVDAIIPFLKRCSRQNVPVKIVLFNHNVNAFNCPTQDDAIERFVREKFRCSGGTDFALASRGLVKCMKQLEQSDPDRRVTVIMCSDGQVPKENAAEGHRIWRTFAESLEHKPFVSCIGVSEEHDADILGKYILNDGIYENAFYRARGNGLVVVTQAFERVLSKCLKVDIAKIELPCAIYSHLVEGENVNHKKSVDIALSDRESQVWCGRAELMQCLDAGEMVITNGVKTPVTVVHTNQQPFLDHREELLYCIQWVKDLTSALRDADTEQEIRERTSMAEAKLKKRLKYLKRICHNTFRKQDRAILKMLQEDANISSDDRERLVEIQRYRKLNKVHISENKRLVKRLQEQINEVTILFKEVLIDQARVENIRKHILDLQFTTRAAMRIEDFVMTEEELAERERKYENIPAATQEEVEKVSNDLGSGCFLSTYTFRDIVLDQDTLWICGRVNRMGGNAMIRPESLEVEYISPHLVSGSFFELALDVNEKGFCDPSREIVNALLLPVVAKNCSKHLDMTIPWAATWYCHAIAGRQDVWGPGPGMWYAVLAKILMEMSHTSRGKELLNLTRNGCRGILKALKGHPLHPSSTSRDYLDKGVNKPLQEVSEDWLLRYTSSPEIRTTRLTAAKYGVMLGVAFLNENVDIPDRFWYDYCFQYVRESHQDLDEDTREWLIYCLLMDGEINGNPSDAKWNKMNLEKALTRSDRIQNQAWVHGVENLPQCDLSPSRQAVIEFVMKPLPLEQINRAVVAMGREPIEFEDEFASVFCALALRVCRNKIPVKWAELMTALMGDTAHVKQHMRHEMIAKLEQEHKMLWKEINEDPIPAVFKAYDNEHTPFLEAMVDRVQHEWSVRCKAIHNCGLPKSISALIAAMCEDPPFSLDDEVIVLLGGNQMQGKILNLQRNGRYEVQLDSGEKLVMEERALQHVCKHWKLKGNFGYGRQGANANGHGDCNPRDWRARWAQFGTQLNITEDQYAKLYRTAKAYNIAHNESGEYTSPEDVFLNQESYQQWWDGRSHGACEKCGDTDEDNFSKTMLRRYGKPDIYQYRCRECTLIGCISREEYMRKLYT